MLIEVLFVGLASYGVVIFLDRAMDYGHALGGIRYWAAYFFADEMDRGMMKNVKEIDVFSERLNMMDELYHQVVIYRPFLLFLLCKSCMAFWVVLIASICTGFSFWEGFLTLGIAYMASTMDN
jgi:hypothetical protein